MSDPLEPQIEALKLLAGLSDNPLERVRSLTEICRLRREQYAQMHMSARAPNNPQSLSNAN